jgi:hypothetical protein
MGVLTSKIVSPAVNGLTPDEMIEALPDLRVVLGHLEEEVEVLHVSAASARTMMTGRIAVRKVMRTSFSVRS